VAEEYCLVADLLGFKSMMRNLDESSRQARVAEWVELVNTVAVTSRIEHLQLVSDSVFVGAPPTKDGLRALINFARDLLMYGLEHSLPARGGIAYGEVTWGDLTHGPAIVNAYALCEAQRWIGASCLPELPHLGDCWDFTTGVFCYPVPVRDTAHVTLRPAVAWDIPLGRHILTAITFGVIHDGEPIQSDLIEKAQNTVLFDMYRTMARKKGLDPRNFNGYLVTDIVQEAVAAWYQSA